MCVAVLVSLDMELMGDQRAAPVRDSLGFDESML